jgi:hypothetical protein
MPESSYQQLRQWRAEGCTDEITRIYDETYFRPSPTKLPAGRIQVNLDNDAAFAEMTLSLGEALATIKWNDGSQAQIF